MAATAVRSSVLDTFRGVWVRGRLDYQRAVEALEAAIQAAERVRQVSSASIDSPEVVRADRDVENARRRVAEIEAVLESQFDRFCGVST